MTSLSLNSFRTGSICGSILKVENETVTDTVPAVFLSWTKQRWIRMLWDEGERYENKGSYTRRENSNGVFQEYAVHLDLIRGLRCVRFSSTAVSASL